MTWLLALTGLAAEADVVRTLRDRSPHRVTDVVEMLAVARSGRADGVFVSARFPQMTREVGLSLARSGVAVWGVVDPRDDVGARLVAEWGMPAVSGADDILAVIDGEHAVSPGDTRRGSSRGAPGRLVTVLGTSGAPGTTTVALNAAVRLTRPALLVDADGRAPSVGFHLGLSGDAPGLRGASRRAELGRLTPQDLLGACHDVARTAVLPAGHGDVVGHALAEVIRATGRTIIADCGSDPEVAAALLSRADLLVLVATPTAVGVHRWLDLVPRVREFCGAERLTVWNQIRGARQGGRLGAAPLARLRRLTARVDPGSTVVGVSWVGSRCATRGPWPQRGGGRVFTELVRNIERRVYPEPGRSEPEQGAGPLGIRVRGALRSA